MKPRIIWYTVDKIIKKVIDFSISDSLLRQFLTVIRIYNLYFESDHRCLVTKLINIPKYNNQALKNDNVNESFCDKLESKLTLLNFHSNNIGDLDNVIISSSSE